MSKGIAFKLVLSLILMVIILFIGITVFIKLPKAISMAKLKDMFNKNPVVDQLKIDDYSGIYYYCYYNGSGILFLKNMTIENIGDSDLNVTPYFDFMGEKFLPTNESCRNVKIEPGEKKILKNYP